MAISLIGGLALFMLMMTDGLKAFAATEFAAETLYRSLKAKEPSK